MAVSQADRNVLGKHLPALGVNVKDPAKPTPDEILAGLERYSKMNNEIGDDKVVFKKEAGFTEEMKTAFSASIQRMNTLFASNPMAKFGIIGMLKAGNETPQQMKNDTDLFFAFLKDGPKIVEALSHLQKEDFFKKPASAQAPAPVTASPPPAASPKPDNSTRNPRDGEHFRIPGKENPEKPGGSPATAERPGPQPQTQSPLANPPPAGSGTSTATPPASTPQTSGTNGGGQGTSPPQNKPPTAGSNSDVNAAADMVKKALGAIAASGAIPDMPVPDGRADPDGKTSVFGKQSNASLHHLLEGIKTLMRFEGKDTEDKYIYEGSLDGQYSPAIGQSLIKGYGKLSAEAKAKILSPEMKIQIAEKFKMPLKEGDDGTTIVATMVAGLDTLYEHNLIDNAEGAKVANKKAEMFLKVLDFMPDSFKGQIFGFLQSSQIGQLLMKMLEAFTGIPISKMMGVKTEGPAANSGANANVKAGVQQDIANIYNKALEESKGDPAKLKQGMFDKIDTVSSLVDRFVPKEHFNKEAIKGVVEKVLNEANGDGATFAAAVMREVDALNGKPKPSSGPAVAPPQTEQTRIPSAPAPVPVPQEQTEVSAPAAGTPMSGNPLPSGAVARTVSYNPVTDDAFNPRLNSTFRAAVHNEPPPRRQPPVPQESGPAVLSTASSDSQRPFATQTAPQTLKGSGDKVELPIIEPKAGEEHFFESKRRLDTRDPENLKIIESIIGIRPTIFDPRHQDGRPGLTLDKDLRTRNVQAIIYGLDGLAQETINNFARRHPGAGLEVGDMIVARDKRGADGNLQTEYRIMNGDKLRGELKSFNPQSGAEGLRNLIEKLHIDNDLHVAVSEIMIADVEIPDGSTKGEIKLTPLRDKASISVVGNIQEYIQVARKEQQENQTARDGMSMKDEKGRNIGVAERYMTPGYDKGELSGEFKKCVQIGPDQQLAVRNGRYVIEGRGGIGIFKQWEENVKSALSVVGIEFGKSNEVDPTKICAPGQGGGPGM